MFEDAFHVLCYNMKLLIGIFVSNVHCIQLMICPILTTFTYCLSAVRQLWKVPESGLKENMTNCDQDMYAHKKRVTTVRFHPTASGVSHSELYMYSSCRLHVYV